MLLNNGFGELPRCLLCTDGAEHALDEISDFMDEESSVHDSSKLRKGGEFSVDYYSSWFYREYATKTEVKAKLIEDQERSKRLCDPNLAINKGIYLYQALDHGNIPGERPVGYVGEVSNGDYFRFLSPTEFCSISEIPHELQRFVAQSRTLDFSETAVLRGLNVEEHFQQLYASPR